MREKEEERGQASLFLRSRSTGTLLPSKMALGEQLRKRKKNSTSRSISFILTRRARSQKTLP